MTRAICAWILAMIVLPTGTARGQVFSGGDSEGAALVPFVTLEPGQPEPTGVMWNGDLQACTSGPDYMTIAGFRYEGIWAVGASSLPGAAYEVPILTMYELAQDSLFDEDDLITALAATPERDAVYVSFHPIFPTAGCLPILRVEFDGTWTEAVTCEEIGAFETGANRVRELATAADGTLYAVVRYQDVEVEAVLRIDPAGPPGKRVEQILSSDTLLPPSPDLAGDVQFTQLAALDKGGLAVLATINVAHEDWQEEGWVLVRRDADGTLTELTARERTADLSGVDVERHLPAYSCRGGMLFDATDRLLVCGGNGNVFLIDPDAPGRSHLTIDSQWVMNAFSSFCGQPVYSPPGGAEGPGGCLGDVSWADHRAYATWMGTFMLFNWDEQLLDLDEDLAMGYQEAARGTHRFVADTDGGGTGDGLELVGYTDPLEPGDDRYREKPVMRWVRPGLWFGSRAGNSTSSRHTIGGSGLAAPDGSLLLFQSETGNELVRFTSYDEPLVPTGQKGGDHMGLGPDGSVYRYENGVGIQRSRPDGTEETLITADALAAVAGTARGMPTGATEVNVNALAVQPDGTVFLGTKNGLLLAVDPSGAGSVVYDAVADYAAAGLWTETEQCFGGMACEFYVGPVTYEPVHGMLMFWIEVDLTGSGFFGFMLDLVARLPDGNLRQVADHWAFSESMGMLGGLEPLDMEPDRAGGVWVLGGGGGGGSQRLLHMEGSRLAPVMGMTVAQPMQFDNPDIGGLSLLWASDLMVTPQGRIFAADPYYSNMSGLVPYGLTELAPLVPGIHGGDLLAVQPDEATLSRLLPDGGGELLHKGEPFKQPTVVAAAGGIVAVGDAGLGKVLVSKMDDQGILGPWTELAAVGVPTGMDIDGEGRILVVDGPGKRLLRVGTDGAVEVLASGDALGQPLDVIATASGAAVVTDTGGERLLRVGKDKAVTSLADLATPGAVALVAGSHYVVASSAGDAWPRTVGPGGSLGATGTEDTSWDLGGGEPVGGMAAAPDGTVYLAMVKGWSWDWKDPFPTLRVFRITTDGYVQSLVRYGLLVGGGPADLCRVRGPGEPLPAEPGDEPLPMPVDEGAGEPKPGGSGCGIGAAGSSTAGLLLLLALLALGTLAAQRRQRPSPTGACNTDARHPLAGDTRDGWTAIAARFLAATLGLLLAACGSSGGNGSADAVGTETWEPGTVAPECKGKELCKPASPPVCVDGVAGSKRCVTDDDGCWILSAVQTCPADAPCQDGVCGGPWCQPACGTFQECGDDGCGGTCGTCMVPEVCCDGFCGTGKADCKGRECGWDSATGSCGTCGDGKVCVDGTCAAAGQAECGQFLRECDNLCEPWDLLCQEQCETWLSPQGRWDLLAYEGCQFLHCAACFEEDADQACLTACIIDFCLEEVATCFNRNGTKNCADTWACAEACDPADQPCIDTCTNAATREALMVIWQLVSCVEAICPPDAPDAERLACEAKARTESCANLADACFGPCEPYCPTWATCGPNGCTGLCGICAANQICNGFECIKQ